MSTRRFGVNYEDPFFLVRVLSSFSHPTSWGALFIFITDSFWSTKFLRGNKFKYSLTKSKSSVPKLYINVIYSIRNKRVKYVFYIRFPLIICMLFLARSQLSMKYWKSGRQIKQCANYGCCLIFFLSAVAPEASDHHFTFCQLLTTLQFRYPISNQYSLSFLQR